MPILPTTWWYCDNCYEPIEEPEHGLLEWITLPRLTEDEPRRGRDFRIVHHYRHRRCDTPTGCQYNQAAEQAKDGSSISDYPLTDFLGSDGLMFLLELIHEERLPVKPGLELIKRLHIPGYEPARQHFTQALDEGVIEPDVEPDFYRQDAIQRVLEAYTDLPEG